MQSDGPPSTHSGIHETSDVRQSEGIIDDTGETGTAQVSNRPAILAGPSTNQSPWYGGEDLPTGQYTYTQEPTYAPRAYPIPSYTYQPQPNHPPNLPRQHLATQHSQPQYSPPSQFFPPGPFYPDQQPFDTVPDVGCYPISNWNTGPIASSSTGHLAHQQFAFNGYGPGDPALDVGPPSYDLGSARPFTTNALIPTNPPVDPHSNPVPTLPSSPKRSHRLTRRRRGGSAAPAPASRSSELAASRSSLPFTGQSAGSSSLSPTSTWPDQSSIAVSFSGAFDLGQYQDGRRISTSSASQPLAPKDEMDLPMDSIPGDKALRSVRGGSRGKRKSEGTTRVTEDEDDEEGFDDEVSRVDKRRNQNKLAQRAFRARTKVQNAEVDNQIAHLTEVNESQSKRLEEMTTLVASLQKENLELRSASVDAGRPVNQQTDPPLGIGDQTDPKPP